MAHRMAGKSSRSIRSGRPLNRLRARYPTSRTRERCKGTVVTLLHSPSSERADSSSWGALHRLIRGRIVDALGVEAEVTVVDAKDWSTATS